MSKRAKTAWATVLLPLTVSLIVVVAVCSLLYLREADQISAGILDREARRMEIYAGLFDRDIDSTVTDLRLLATGDGLQAYLLSGSADDLKRAIRRAQFFSTENPEYDQVRYLDKTGQEVFRVNAKGVIATPDQLQNKADRPYFQKARNLPPGQIFISRLDLNVEHGVIEQPLKPTIRFSMPVFDGNGQRCGVYVINYLGAKLMDHLQYFAPRFAQRQRILNAQGYWLRAASPDQEWGFLLPGRNQMTLAQTDPALWAQILAAPQGQTFHNGGYFTWRREVPSESVPNRPVTLIAEDPFYVIASEVSPMEWTASFAGLRQTFVMVAIILMALATVISWFFNTRHRAQQERDRFFNLTRDLLCIAGMDGRFQRVNPAWEEAIGFTPDEMIGRAYIDFVHPDDREKTLRETDRLAEGEETALFENRYRCKDGSYRWLLWNARPLVEEQLIYGSARDLTERRKIEEALRQYEARSRSIIESAHDAFVSIDAGGRILDWNLQAEKIFGWPRTEAIGRLLHETIIPPKYREAHRRGMQHLQATGEGPVLNQTLELTALRRNGDEFPVEFVIWPLRTGNEATFHAFVRDITARKEAAERIQKLNEEMKSRAELLEVANKELESFSYSVSHDLRAPLRHIHGFVELLQKSDAVTADASNQRYMEIIARAAKEMGHLIDDLLAFSRTGRIDMHPVLVDMEKLVEQIIKDREIEGQGRCVVWDVKPLAQVACDPNLIRLVWTNLIDNALKYTRPRPEAHIEIGQTDKGSKGSTGLRVTYYVRDNGVGFDMQYAAKLFGVFQRLHSAEEFEGTGIGLANVQRIVHRHGGRVWAESVVDGGSTFYFSLPIVAASPAVNHVQT